MTTRESRFRDLLKGHDLKATPLRLKLLTTLSSLKKPSSVPEIKTRWKSVDTVTLYRMLEALADASIVRRVNLQHGHTDYELIMDDEHHHHAVCTDCGIVEDIEGCVDANLESKILRKSKGFASFDQHALEFFGICTSCAA